MQLVKETFRMESNRAKVTFNKVKSRVLKLKVNRLTYTTASASNYQLLVRLSGWMPHEFHVSSALAVEYTFMQTLPRTTLTEVDYEAQYGQWDVEEKEPRDLFAPYLELWINGSSTNTDITPSNPVFIEFEIMTED